MFSADKLILVIYYDSVKGPYRDRLYSIIFSGTNLVGVIITIGK